MSRRSKKSPTVNVPYRASEELYQVLFEQAVDGIFIADEQGHYVEVNQRGCEMLGYPREELLTLSMMDLIPNEDLARDPLPLGELRVGKILLEERGLRCKDGRLLLVETRTQMLADRNLLVMVRDISERRQAQELLQKREHEFRTLMENSPDFIGRYDRGARIVYVNPALERLFGKPLSQLLGKTSAEISPGVRVAQDLDEKIREVLETGSPVETEILVNGVPGQAPFYYHLRFVPEYDHEGQTVSVLFIGRDITALKETERQFRTLTEHSPDIIARFDRECRYLYVNTAAEKVTGIPAQDLLDRQLGQVLSERFSPVAAEEILSLCQAIEQVFITGAVSETEIKLPLPDGEYIFNVRLIPEYNQAGKVASVLHLARDITERKRAEDQLRESNERFRLLAESSLTGIYLIQESLFRYVNPAMAHIFGYEVEEITDKLGPMDLVCPDDRPLVAENIRRRVEGEADAIHYDFCGLRKDGSVIYVEVHGRRIEYSGKTGVIGTLVDVTERKRAEEALRTSEERLQLALDAAQMGLWTWNIATGEIVWSQQCLALYGLPPETQISYERFLQAIHPEDRERIDAALRRAVEERTSYDETKRTVWPDGSIHWTASRGQVYYDAAGEPARMTGVTFDITNWKEVEEELRCNREAALQFSEQLAVLQEVTNQLSKAESTDDLCRQAVQLGRSRLGFDRVSIWFIEEDLDVMHGSFGTDESGRLRDERNATVKFRHEGLAWRVFSQKESNALVEHHSLHNHVAREVGEGDNAVAALWDGDEVVGIISIDNFFTHRPITDRQLEVLRLYATTLGHLITRKRAQEALALFRTLTDYTNDAIEVIDPATGRFLDANEQAYHNLGYTREEFLNLSVLDINPLAADRSWQETMDEFRRSGSLVRESQHQRKDGSIFPVEININYIRLDRDYVLGVVRDITERKEVDVALRASEERYRALYRDNPSMFFTLDSDGVIISVNTFGASQLGYTIEELEGQSVLKVFYKDDQTAVKTQLQRCVQIPGQINQWQFRKVRKDGSLLWVEEFARAVTAPNGAINILIVCQNITGRKRAEIEQKRLLAKIQEQAQQVQNIIDTVPEGVILLSKDQVVTLTNPLARKYLTILEPELRNGRLTHLGNRPLNELLTSPPKGLWHEITSDDLVFEAIARPVENSPDNGGWVLVLRDITQERDIQQRVQRQERLAAVGQLAAGIAHDFNNILAVILLHAQFITRTTSLPTSAKEQLYIIEQQTQRATELIRQILDFSRQSVLERQPLDLLPFMKKMVALLERTLPEHVRIKLGYATDVFFIHADPTRMQQVIMNLAVNARDAMPEGGHLHIRLAHVQTEEPRSMSIQDLPPGNWIQIEMADSGNGIPAEIISNIFEPFFTTKRDGKGTGLGLAQVYGIVQQHEGFIDVATEIGQGTTFSLYFPALSIDENTGNTSDRSVLQVGQGQRILLVEDDPDTRQALANSLALMNYNVVEATNGREALEILATEVDEVDLVLSDTVMPEMGGIALYHAMREQKLSIPVVLITGHPLSKEMENLQTLGLAGWLPKPIDLVTLSYLLSEALVG